MKRGQSGLVAVIAVDKPAGCTSHDVVGMVRRATGERRVGHAGTLDPFATGLLIVCIGAATRLSERISDASKGYIARIAFGRSTDTDDLTGKPTGEGEAPGDILDAVFASDRISGLVGTIDQMPPAYSAKKVGGRRSYEAARHGEVLELTPSRVTIHSAMLIATGTLEEGPSAGLPFWDVALEVSKGTYIRSIARDLGSEFGCGAHLAELRRTSIGSTRLSCALDPENLGDLSDAESLEKVALDPVGLLGLPVLNADVAEMSRVRNGAPITVDATRIAAANVDTTKVCVVSDSRLHAVYRISGGVDAMFRDRLRLECEIMIPGGVCGAGR